jgi:hypothetical protein
MKPGTIPATTEVELDAKFLVQGAEQNAKIQGELMTNPSKYGFKGTTSSSWRPDFATEIEIVRNVGPAQGNNLLVDIKVGPNGKIALIKTTSTIEHGEGRLKVKHDGKGNNLESKNTTLDLQLYFTKLQITNDILQIFQ